MESMSESGKLVPDAHDAERALTEAHQRQHQAIDAAYSAPPKYFWGVAAALLPLASAYLAWPWVEDTLGFIVATALVLVCFAITVGAIAGLYTWVSAWQGAAVRQHGFSRQDLPLTIAVMLMLAAGCGLGWLIFADIFRAIVFMIAVEAVLVAVGGPTLQALLRARAHRRVNTRHG